MLRLALFALCCLVAFPAAASAQSRSLMLVELFTSQGCGECTAANRALGRLAEERDVLALTFPVDYWDYLGWRDTFAQAAFSDRQRAYARRFAGRGLYTPQFVLNGAAQNDAADEEEVLEMIAARRARAPARIPALGLSRRSAGGFVAWIGQGRPGVAADVWAIAFDPEAQIEAVTAGENAGQRVPHYNLVRRIERLGSWSGRPRSFVAASCVPACALIVQRPNGGSVIAAARRLPTIASAQRQAAP